MATAQKQLDKSEDKANTQEALTATSTGLGLGAEAANLTGAGLMSNPFTYAAGVATAAGGFALNISAQILDQQATQYGQEASEIYDTASKDMQNASAKYSASSKMLADKKESIANNMMARNVARNQEILNATRGDNSLLASNHSKIQSLEREQNMINSEIKYNETENQNGNNQKLFFA